MASRLPGLLVRALASAAGPAASHHGETMARRREMVGRHLARACRSAADAGVYACGNRTADPDPDPDAAPDTGDSRTAPARLDALVDETFGSYARYWAESLRLPGSSAARIDAGMSWVGIGRIAQAVAEGRGAILALPHLGGWEWGGFWMVQQGYQVTVVVEALEPPELFEWFAGFRRSLGMEVVPVGPAAAAAVIRALRAGGVVCLLCDRNIGGASGVPVEFFGERTELPAGPAVLAMRTGARLLPSAVYFDGPGDGHLAVVRPPLSLKRTGSLRADAARITQQLASELEVLIRRAPTQWHLMQPNWPSDPGYGLGATVDAEP